MRPILSLHSTADYPPCRRGIYVHRWMLVFEYISGIAGVEGGVYVTPHRSTYIYYILESAWEIRIHFRECGVYSNFLVSNPRVIFGWEDTDLLWRTPWIASLCCAVVLKFWERSEARAARDEERPLLSEPVTTPVLAEETEGHEWFAAGGYKCWSQLGQWNSLSSSRKVFWSLSSAFIFPTHGVVAGPVILSVRSYQSRSFSHFSYFSTGMFALPNYLFVMINAAFPQVGSGPDRLTIPFYTQWRETPIINTY